MTEETDKHLQNNALNEAPWEEAQKETLARRNGAEPRTKPGNFRDAAYVVLFVAAVLVINAMETGSYRTPWPVPLVVTLVGLGLFGYSWYLQFRSKVQR